MESYPSSKAAITIPAKFSEDECLRVLNELAVTLPEEAALRLLKCGGLRGVSLAPELEATLEQEYFKLRAAVFGTRQRPGIVQFLPEIQSDCHSVLHSKQVLCAANKARKPDTAGLVRALSIPGNVSRFEKLYTVYDTVVESSYDTYENRLVKAYMQAIYGRISRLHARVEANPANFAFAHEMDNLINSFRLARSRATFLNDVKTPFITLSYITMVLLKKPAYRAVLEGYLDLLKQFLVRLDEPNMVHGLKAFPSLYQIWGTLKVVNAALQVCGQFGYRATSHPLLSRDNIGLFVQLFADGQPAVELTRRTTGTKIKIIPMNKISPSDNQNAAQEQLRFLAIEVCVPGKQPGVILFDTKYQAGIDGAELAVAPIKEDVLNMLVSLNTSRSAEDAATILYAAVLYPGQRKTFSPMVEALQALPSNGPALDNILNDVLKRCLSA